VVVYKEANLLEAVDCGGASKDPARLREEQEQG
jgi:hypothetical protein